MIDNRKVLVLVWSLPEEPEFLDYLTAWHDEYVICPLRPAAMDAARRFVPAENIVDVDGLVSPSARSDMFSNAIAAGNALRKKLMGRSSQPWASCLEYDATVPQLFYHIEYWSALLAALRERFSDWKILHHGPISLAAIGGFYTLQIEILQILLSSSDPRRTFRTRCSEVIRGWAGAVVNRCASVLVNGSAVDPKGGECRLLVCGLQSADTVFQKGYVARLQRAGIAGVKWLVQEKFYTRLTEDEARVSGDDNLDDLTVRIDARGRLSWKKDSFRRLSEYHVLRTVRQAIMGVLDGKYRRGQIARFADTLMMRSADLRIRYLNIEQVLNRIRPERIVGFANYGDMVFVRKWCHRNGVAHLRFSGVEYLLDQDYAWDCDRLAVLGDLWRRDLAEARPEMADSISVSGGLYWAEQALAAKPDHGNQENPWTALFMVSPNQCSHFPDSFQELEQDYRAMASALSAGGGRLMIRLHPRMVDLAAYQRLVARLQSEGVEFGLADPRESLSQQLADSRIVLIRNWSGAALFALYAGKPFIGWLPRPGNRGSDRVMQRMPTTVCNEEELRVMTNRLLSDESFEREVLAKQAAFLEDHVADPYGDPYKEAVRITEEFIR